VQRTTPNVPNSEREPQPAIIDELLFIVHVIQTTPSQSIPSRPHSYAEKGGQGVIKYYLPKYKISPPKNPPHPAQKPETVSGHLGISYYSVPTLLTLVYKCPQSRPMMLSTPPTYPAPTACQPPYLHTQRTILVIPTNPGPSANTLAH
jgi:hypothetical protein